jgi:hypothetical protein
VISDERCDGSLHCVNVLLVEIQLSRALPGGFRIAQRVVASRDLFADDHRIVLAGTNGVVMRLYGETRLTVAFAEGGRICPPGERDTWGNTSGSLRPKYLDSGCPRK